ncbi:hypothetical protein XENOCAPTIV_013373, partial [Xenoophorus captivus]
IYCVSISHQNRLVRQQTSVEVETPGRRLEKMASLGPADAWDQLQLSGSDLRIKDLDFSDLLEEEDIDVLDMDSYDSTPSSSRSIREHLTFPESLDSDMFRNVSLYLLPVGSVVHNPDVSYPLQPLFNCLREVKDCCIIRTVFVPLLIKLLCPCLSSRGLCQTGLSPFAKSGPKISAVSFHPKGPETKKSEILVLDPKRSNAINIGLTVLPAIHVIKSAILSFDEFAISKEGIEKILTMIPTEEEKQKIQEAQVTNPDVPLGTAEQFLLTLASINALTPRLQLWAFKLNYEALEKPLFDLKLGMEQLASNQTFRRILATLLAIGNFLNSSNVRNTRLSCFTCCSVVHLFQAKGFELSYLEKVVEVKDTVHRHSLLHHTCSLVMENYPESTDIYSEIPAITRSAKVDFDLLAENLVQLERRCKASWDNLKVVAKHETKAVLKNRMTEFLKDCTQRIKILNVVHRRVINR